MYLAIDPELAEKFQRAAGSKTKATLLIMEELDCSLSKAGKIAANRYPSQITASENDRLVRLFKRTISTALRQQSRGKAS